ncbi:hypothetical protein AMJ85_04650 [candidate division BRC1 bacterium SM23_51]|nr:MAG: hypothetical protein AMJ85_04650 [candidate division BRC1 bacterium SM23_51]
MSVEVEHLYERLSDIETQLAELRSLLVARLDAHERYHCENEHRWGVIKWCHRYPFRMLALVASLVLALVGELRDPVLAWLVQLARASGG